MSLRAAREHPGLETERVLWKAGARRVAGVDEAGRGPLAGPVVAAAVVLHEAISVSGIDDSKKLSARMREGIYSALTSDPLLRWSVAVVDSREIDRTNILRASQEAMRKAVLALGVRVDHALIDGLPVRPFPVPSTALVGGDALSMSIAAASVIAKVTRDRMMDEYDAEFPQYGFAQHRGYATRTHLDMLSEHGPCRIHRRSFAPVAQMVLPL